MTSRTINEKINALFEVTNSTSGSLAAYLKVNPSTVSHWRTRRNGTPSPEYLPKIAEFFGITIEELYSEYPEEKLSSERISLNACKNLNKSAQYTAITETFSDSFKTTLVEIATDKKLVSDIEELLEQFKHLDPWRRHIVLANVYELNETQKNNASLF